MFSRTIPAGFLHRSALPEGAMKQEFGRLGAAVQHHWAARSRDSGPAASEWQQQNILQLTYPNVTASSPGGNENTKNCSPDFAVLIQAASRTPQRGRHSAVTSGRSRLLFRR